MEIIIGNIRNRKWAKTWTCKIQYNSNKGDLQIVHIHADSKEQCKQRVEEQLDKIQKEHGQG